MWRPQVIVIGAGAAGLAAAQALSSNRIAVLLLEARQRLGGRIHTLADPLSPVPIELGAEFIHGRPPEIFDAIQAARLPVLEVAGQAHSIENGRIDPAGDRGGGLDSLMPALQAAPEQSFADFIASSSAPPEVRRHATSYVEGFNAARAERIGIRGVVQMQKAADAIEGDRAFRLVRGYSSLIDWLWNSLDHRFVRIRFGAAVQRIAWRAGRVEIQSTAGPFEAPRAIVTLPLGVLQSGAVAIDPHPPALRDACAVLETGHAIRMVLRFRRPVWHDRAELSDLGFLFSSESWMPTWWTTLPVHTNVITGWMAGRLAEEREDCSPDRWLADSLATLARLLGSTPSALAGDLEDWHTYNWRDDPFARGAYSYPRPGALDAQRRFADPIDDTLYFAGEATNSAGHEGTVHGAIASARHAVRRILESPGRPDSGSGC